jgi:hypothetical protein
VTAAIFEGNVVRDKVKLNAFGNFTSPCTSDIFATGEIVRDFVFYYLDSKVLGISYTTSAGNAQTVGLKQVDGIKSFGFTFSETFNFMGFFGTYSDVTVISLGPIRFKTDCAYFSS